MRHTLNIILAMAVIILASGCVRPPGADLGRLTPNVVPPARNIEQKAASIQQDAKTIEKDIGTAPHPKGGEIGATARGIQRTAGSIGRDAKEIAGLQSQITRLEKHIDELNGLVDKERQDATKAVRRWRSWTFAGLVVLGAVGLIAAGVVAYLGGKRLGGALAVASLLSVVVGLLMPILIAASEAVALVLKIGIIVVAAGALAFAAWYVWKNRRALEEVVKATDVAKGKMPAEVREAVFGAPDKPPDGSIMALAQAPSTKAVVAQIRGKSPLAA